MKHQFNFRLNFKKNFPYYFVGLIALLALSSAALKSFTPEDTWICDKGEWVKHGNPKGDKPTTDCHVGFQASSGKSDAKSATDDSIQKQGDLIIYEPSPKDAVGSAIHIRGEAKGGWFFEASFPIILVDAEGKALATTTAQAQGEWMTEDYVPFIADIKLDKPAKGTGFLIFRKDNPSGLPQNDKAYPYPIKLSEPEQMAVQIYFGNSQKNPDAKDCTAVYAVSRSVAKSQETARAALSELLAGPTAEEKAQGYQTGINSGVSIKKIIIENGVAKVDFSAEFSSGMAGSCRVMSVRAQIERTLKQFSTVKQVIISVDGKTEGVLQP